MKVVVYDTLPDEAVKIRESVFVKEQGFQKEFDEIDEKAKHLILLYDEIAVATCRFFEGISKKTYMIGRIAVLKSYRGKNLGSYLLEQAEMEIRKIGGETVMLHAQQQAKPFYQKQGYLQYGDIDFDEDCPHIWMRKELKQKTEQTILESGK